MSDKSAFFDDPVGFSGIPQGGDQISADSVARA
jgi:hypothetical protein